MYWALLPHFFFENNDAISKKRKLTQILFVFEQDDVWETRLQIFRKKCNDFPSSKYAVSIDFPRRRLLFRVYEYIFR